MSCHFPFNSSERTCPAIARSTTARPTWSGQKTRWRKKESLWGAKARRARAHTAFHRTKCHQRLAPRKHEQVTTLSQHTFNAWHLKQIEIAESQLNLISQTRHDVDGIDVEAAGIRPAACWATRHQAPARERSGLGCLLEPAACRREHLRSASAMPSP